MGTQCKRSTSTETVGIASLLSWYGTRSLVISSCFRGFRTRSKTVGFEIAFIVDLSSRDRSVAPAAFGARSEETLDLRDYFLGSRRVLYVVILASAALGASTNRKSRPQADIGFTGFKS